MFVHGCEIGDFENIDFIESDIFNFEILLCRLICGS